MPRVAVEEPVILVGARLPVREHAALERLARENDLSLSQVVRKALRRELEAAGLRRGGEDAPAIPGGA